MKHTTPQTTPEEVMEAAKRLQERFPAEVREIRQFKDEVTVVIGNRMAHTIIESLKNDPKLPFDFLVDVTAVDYLDYDDDERYGVVYHLLSLEKNLRIRVTARVDDPEPRIRSISDLWPAANWAEREVFEMFGIIFEGHPNLKRLLTPDYMEGYPLRKDYPTEGLGERDEFEENAIAPEDVLTPKPVPISGDLN